MSYFEGLTVHDCPQRPPRQGDFFANPRILRKDQFPERTPGAHSCGLPALLSQLLQSWIDPRIDVAGRPCNIEVLDVISWGGQGGYALVLKIDQEKLSTASGGALEEDYISGISKPSPIAFSFLVC